MRSVISGIIENDLYHSKPLSRCGQNNIPNHFNTIKLITMEAISTRLARFLFECKIQISIIHLLVFFIVTITTTSQTIPSYYNYYTIRDAKIAYFEKNPVLKTTPGSGYKDFLRWDYFWSTRKGGTDTSTKGDMRDYGNELNNYLVRLKNNKTSEYTSNWQYLGPKNLLTSKSFPYLQCMGKVTAVYVDLFTDPSGRIIFAGTESSGLWKTINRGLNWVNVTDQIPLLCGITGIASDPFIQNVLYISTGTNPAGLSPYSYGIFKSSDGGISWQHVLAVSPWMGIINSGIFVHHVIQDVVYAYLDDIVLRSKNGGLTWPDTIFGGYQSFYHLSQMSWRKKYLIDIEMKPGSNDTMYICSNGFWVDSVTFNTAEVWMSTNVMNTNVTWTRLDQSFIQPMNSWRYEMAVTPADKNSIVIIGVDSIRNGNVSLYKSDSGGIPFRRRTKVRVSLADENRLELLISPVDTSVIYIGGGQINRLLNFKDPVESISGHVDVRASIIYNNGNSPLSDTLIIGNDGGISFSPDGGRTNENINGDGLHITQLYGMGAANSAYGMISAGALDNSFFVSGDAGWHNRSNGDAGNILVDPLNPQLMFGNSWGSDNFQYNILKTEDAWISDQGVGQSQFHLEPSSYNRPLLFHPTNPEILYTGFRNVYRSTNRGASFQRVSLFESMNNPVDSSAILSAIAIAPSNDSVVYAAFHGELWSTNNMKKLYKTNNQWKDSVAEWIDLSYNNNTLGCLYNQFITDIAISPTNPDSVWISFSGYSNNRVLFSRDGGYTWTNYSDSLPNLPIHCLRYLKGSNAVLFAGTDGGVFCRASGQSAWHSFNNNLPAPIISDIEINDTLQLIRVATFGRGIWESQLHCNFVSDTMKIVSDTIWRSDFTVDRSILVKSPAHLTIKSKVRFPPQAKVFVEPGAQLIVDGGHLTRSCGSQWQGIEVWGDRTKVQNSLNQGWVYFRNNAVLEHARIGVSTCKTDTAGNILWNTTGGFITATNCIFRNNYKAVQILSYPYRQHSKFDNVSFESDEGELNDVNNPHVDFISMFDVFGVQFNGCRFINLTVDTVVVPTANRRYGIYSINSAFKVDELCVSQTLPCSQFVKSEFTGLGYAIRCENFIPSRFAEINNSVFQNNYRGVYLSCMNNAYITRNTFKLPKSYQFYPGDTTYCLYLNNNTGYRIEENVFKSNSTQYLHFNQIGLIINNSGTDPNEVYNNTFNRVKYAILAQDQNRSADSLVGLCLKCNDFINTKQDISVAISDPNQSNYWGIAVYQGDSLITSGPAGNTFSKNHSNNTFYCDLNNEEGARYKYYHHAQDNDPNSPKLEPKYYLNIAVRPTEFAYSKEIACPSKLPIGGSGIEELKTRVEGETDTIRIKESLLIAMVDGGNTDSLAMGVILSVPSVALEIRDDLLNKSPYLSDTVMKSAIANESVLPNEMIRDILVANPQSATSDAVLEKLDDRFIPMPDPLMAEILANEEVISAIEANEADIVAHKNKRMSALYDLIRIYKSDTLNICAVDSLIRLMQKQYDPTIQYQLAFEYLALGDTIGINNILSFISANDNLSTQQSRVHENYLSLFFVLKKLAKEERNIFSMDSISISSIRELHNYGIEPVKTLSANILSAIGQISYNEPLLLPTELKESKEKRSFKTGKLVERHYLRIFPNPARSYVIIEYNLQEKYVSGNESSLVLTRMDGNPIFCKQVSKRQDQELIKLDGFLSGTYFCSLLINGILLETKKFVITD